MSPLSDELLVLHNPRLADLRVLLLMRKLLVALAIGAGTIVPITAAQVAEAPKADAAVYCAPWVDYWCYQKYLRCGPYVWNRWMEVWRDSCGNWLL